MNGKLWVVDTNVVVAGILAADANSPPARILEAILAGQLRFLLSVELLAEYRSVLLRQHIRARHGLAPQAVDAILEALAVNAAVAEIAERTETAPDPGDNHFWRLLAAKPGTGLITGDALLLDNPPLGARVLTPREFFAEETGN
ncbi:MAG TPA: putative toxin-antitoxin system toxin component, PIN family [Gammaproteobacteria bacterium]|nr:putative toxin-antitoxin system toxin component, PIN family [Gammaproteobacteria bacterium]